MSAFVPKIVGSLGKYFLFMMNIVFVVKVNFDVSRYILQPI